MSAERTFTKRLPLAERWRLEAEADGLSRLARTGAIRVPEVRVLGETGDSAWIELEWLDLHAAGPAADARLGRSLAQLHRVAGADFGLERDNAIGATPQPNGPAPEWPDFWRRRRLGFQLERAERNGVNASWLDRGRRLLDHVGDFFGGYRPVPSLLHGDLWAGNHGTLADGTPVVFDPAVYYGDREADLAMTRLFGGFGAAFYAAYDDEWPLDPGAGARIDLYNLYHVLNHFNIFGGSYRAQAESMIDRLLAAAGH